jgi:Bacterial dnaA protein helix-turn-helix
MFAPKPQRFQLSPRVPLAIIDETVSARLGTTRVRGNAQPAVFNRQVAMYLAKNVGGWSTTRIGKFYNGRHHSTVCYALKRIEALRQAHPDIDALLTNLADEIRSAAIRPLGFQKPAARKPRLGRFAEPV